MKHQEHAKRLAVRVGTVHEEQKKLLITVHQDPNPQQRVCVAKWARRNGLKAVFVNMQFPEG